MAVLWTDGTWTAAYAVTAPEFESPIPGVATAYVFRQDYMQLAANFTPAIDTAHGTHTDFYIVAESPRRPLGCGVVQWTRTYAKIPADHSDYESYVYTFPGYMGVIAYPNVPFASVPAGIPIGREPKSETVTARILQEYFLCATGQTYETPDAIPVTSKTKYYFTDESSEAKYLADSPPYAVESTPSRTTYDGYITSETELVAEDSKITRWMGNIWRRSTVYVVAQ